MRWPWKRDTTPARDMPDPERARRELERIRGRRTEVEALSAQIREHVRRNNFAANTFALDPRRKP